jgi:CHAD domain-containing protein
MDYTIPKYKDVAPEFIRVCTTLCDDASRLLEDPEGNIHGVIHGVRKIFKKQRALFRLLYSFTKDNHVKEESDFFRDLGRSISGMRDVTSFIEIVLGLREKHDPEKQNIVFDTILEQLEAKRKYVFDNLLNEQELRSILGQNISESKARIEAWDLSKIKWADLITANTKNYKSAFKLMHAAKDEKDPEIMHEWRKKVKIHLYQIGVFKPLWPRIMGALRKEIKILSEYLGDFQNLSILIAAIKNGYIEIMDEAQRKELFKLFKSEQKIFKKKALKDGAFVFSEKPKVWQARLTSYCKS